MKEPKLSERLGKDGRTVVRSLYNLRYDLSSLANLYILAGLYMQETISKVTKMNLPLIFPSSPRFVKLIGLNGY